MGTKGKQIVGDPITYNLIVHILGEEVEHEDEFETLLS
jgi:ferritin-like protein